MRQIDDTPAAFREGQKARSEGRTSAANPYETGTSASLDWQDGYDTDPKNNPYVGEDDFPF